MEVTRSNFIDVLTELDEVLNDATFLAIDGEFTGLNSGPYANAFDTPSQYYAKLRTGSMDFLLVQFGLSVFTYNSNSKKYSQRSYNFYVFPKPFDRSSPDCRFMCQASSIAFLADQGFDFNKLFKYGIPYLTKTEEEKLNKKVEEKQRVKEESSQVLPVFDEDEICSKTEEFIDSENEPLTIRPNNRYQYSDVCKNGSKENGEQKEAGRREKVKLEVQQAVGLSALLKKIADSGKLIVGHNMLLDLCHIIHQFFGPLPESYEDFKSLVHCLFPKLMDTKVICQSAQFRDSVPSILDQLLETLNRPPFSIPETENVTDRSYTLSNNKLHEAGFDAYATGICFISLCNRPGSLLTPEVSKILGGSPLLNPYLNKLLIAKLKDYPYINLTGEDPNPSRDNVFHITFPKQWKLSDLLQVFAPYGGAYISWISDTTAFAALNRRDQVSAVVQNLFKSTQYSLKKYREYQANLENGKPVKQERKRKASESNSPSKDSPPEPEAATDGATNTVNSSPSHKDPKQDGWEVASGNDHDSKHSPQHHDDDDEEDEARAISRELTPPPPARDPEEFCLVGKVRQKSPRTPSWISAPQLSIAASTRYTILGDLDDDEEDDDDDDEVEVRDDPIVDEEQTALDEIYLHQQRVSDMKKLSSPKKHRVSSRGTTDSPRASKRSLKKSVLLFSPEKKRSIEQAIRRRTSTSNSVADDRSDTVRLSPLRRSPRRARRFNRFAVFCQYLIIVLQILGVLVVYYVIFLLY